MIKGCKICGVKDSDTLNYIINHTHPPKFIGFICNYPKSSRYVEASYLKKLLNVNKNKTQFVAVLVKPNDEILEKIKSLPLLVKQVHHKLKDLLKLSVRQRLNKKACLIKIETMRCL